MLPNPLIDLMNDEKQFQEVLEGFSVNPRAARGFLECCAECRIDIQSDPPGLNWRDLQPREICKIAMKVLSDLRKQLVLH